jgi:hypothetical protein
VITEINPTQKVPCIDEDGFKLRERLVLVAYHLLQIKYASAASNEPQQLFTAGWWSGWFNTQSAKM